MFTNQDLKKLIVPLFLEQLLVALVGIADVFVIGFVGEAAVSGVSLVDSINILLLQLMAALATGGAVVASQYIGKRDRVSACSAAICAKASPSGSPPRAGSTAPGNLYGDAVDSTTTGRPGFSSAIYRSATANATAVWGSHR